MKNPCSSRRFGATSIALALFVAVLAANSEGNRLLRDGDQCADVKTAFNFQRADAKCPSSCSTGMVQSPIKIPFAMKDTADCSGDQTLDNNLPKMIASWFTYESGKWILKVDPVLNNDGIGELVYDSHSWLLRNVSFSYQSDHRLVDNLTQPMEIQFAFEHNPNHIDTDGNQLLAKGAKVVISQLVQHSPNTTLTEAQQVAIGVLDQIAISSNTAVAKKEQTSITLNLNALIDTSKGYFRYYGSDTYWPCTELTTWIVMNAPIYASPLVFSAQETMLTAFNTSIGGRLTELRNNRDLQPLNKRNVYGRCGSVSYVFDGKKGSAQKFIFRQ